jgi:hypothetical protein
MRITEIITESKKQRLDPSCWKGYRKAGTKMKGDTRVNNCVPNESVEESDSFVPGDNPMVLPFEPLPNPDPKSGNPGEWTPTPAKVLSIISPTMKAVNLGLQGAVNGLRKKVHDAYPKLQQDPICPPGHRGVDLKEKAGKHNRYDEAANPAQQAAIAVNMKKKHKKPKSLDEQFDMIEEMVESLAEQYGVDSEAIWEHFESVDDNKLFEVAAWQKKSGKNKNGGLNQKGVNSYRREHPGSKLQTAVTTKPSKLKPGSKAAKRRKSFCARMGGMKGPMKKPNGEPTRKALSLRKWNC